MPKKANETFRTTADNTHITNEVFTKIICDLFEQYLGIVYEIKWKFIRFEYQHRGTIHAHILVKLKNEPVLCEKLSNGETIKCDGLIQIGKLCIKAHKYHGILKLKGIKFDEISKDPKDQQLIDIVKIG